VNILWSSNAPWTSSGYGQQTAMFVPKFAALGHNMAISCFYGLEGGMVPGWADKTRGEFVHVPCYPTDWTRFGSLLLPEYAKNHGGGDKHNTLVFTLQDLWVHLQAVGGLKGLRFVCWTPVDHDPCPPKVAEFLRQVDAQVVALTRHGQRMLEDQEIEVVGRVPHGVDTKVFFPDRANQDAHRESLGLPTDAFVVGMVACNQGVPSRKSFPQVFEAFAEFQKRHSDAVLYVHGDVIGHNNGVNLLELGKACGIPNTALRTSDQLALHLGIPAQTVAGVFNCFDVLCMPSMGEGFGIPAIEAQACGVPVILSDWTALSEHRGAGWLVQGDRWWDQFQSSFQVLPRVGEILDALEEAYEHAEGMSGEAVEFAKDYDADLVMERDWVPVLDEVTRPREIEPLRLAA
jgi:glycosyltransferase involved in cell wall biosynthesis